MVGPVNSTGGSAVRETAEKPVDPKQQEFGKCVADIMTERAKMAARAAGQSENSVESRFDNDYEGRAEFRGVVDDSDLMIGAGATIAYKTGELQTYGQLGSGFISTAQMLDGSERTEKAEGLTFGPGDSDNSQAWKPLVLHNIMTEGLPEQIKSQCD